MLAFTCCQNQDGCCKSGGYWSHFNAPTGGQCLSYPSLVKFLPWYLLKFFFLFSVWDLNAASGRGINTYGWRWSASGTLVNQLASCKNQPESIRACALNDSACNLSHACTQQTPAGASELVLPAHLQKFTWTPLPSPLQSSLLMFPKTAGGLRTNAMGFPDSNSILSPLPDGIDLSSAFTSPASLSAHLCPEDSISVISAASSSSQTPILPPSTSGLSQRPSSLSGLARSASGSGGWTKARQDLFKNLLAHLTASADLPFSWVDNPVWHIFCNEFIPAAKSPSQKVLTTQIIPCLVTGLWEMAKAKAKGKYATLKADGWTGENHHHLIAFMITTEKKVESKTILAQSSFNW